LVARALGDGAALAVIVVLSAFALPGMRAAMAKKD
jgi:hypothetical protein